VVFPTTKARTSEARCPPGRPSSGRFGRSCCWKPLWARGPSDSDAHQRRSWGWADGCAQNRTSQSRKTVRRDSLRNNHMNQMDSVWVTRAEAPKTNPFENSMSRVLHSGAAEDVRSFMIYLINGEPLKDCI